MKSTNISNLYLYPNGRVAMENKNMNESASATLLTTLAKISLKIDRK